MQIHPFNVREFVKENRTLVKKYIRKNTYRIQVDDIFLGAAYYYQKNEQILNKKEKPEYSLMQKLEYIKCMKSCVYFTQKYIKIISIDDGVIPFHLYDYQEELLGKYQKNRFIITLQARQTGKMIDLDTPIMTPNGFVKNGDLKVGDKIYGRNGKTTNVTFISEQRNDMNQYELTFDNGQKIKACGEHLWAFKSSNKNKSEYVRNTEYMISEFENVKKYKTPGSLWVDITKPLKFEAKEVPIDPYTLGLWLGDGDKQGGSITGHIDDFNFYKTILPITKGKFSLDKRTESTGKFRIDGLHKNLRLENLTNNKHIPDNYIYNDIETRINLIRGLMDSDGYCAENGLCEFYQKSKSIIDQVRLVLSTLGIKTTIRKKYVKGYVDPYYTLAFCVPVDKFEIFKLPRKLERQANCKSHPKNKRIYLSSYKKLEKEEKVYMQCLTVDDDDHMFVCGETLIPTHNTQTTAAYILWFNTFNDSKDSAILANRLAQAQEIMERVQMSYENLPNFLKCGVSEYNKRSMKFANYSKIFCATSTSSSIRGKSISLLYIDECSFLRNDMAFYESTYPVITSGKNSQVIVSSTPNGARGLFYKLYTESVECINKYVNHKVTWDMVPGRDKEWKEEQIANTSEEQFDQEHNVLFRGSSNSLISSNSLQKLIERTPVEVRDDLKIYAHPVLPDNEKEGHIYAMTVDVSRGLAKDYSAFIVFDVTQIPYKVVATYRNNKISPLLYPTIINSTAKYYNNAMVLVEINDIGEQVASILHNEYEYEELLMTKSDKSRQIIWYGTDCKLGVRTTTAVKAVGCSNVKTLIENDKIELNDKTVIDEFGTFIPKGKSYEADSGANDDFAMCCVLFAWLTTQQYFKDMTDLNTRVELLKDKQNNEQLTPFGFIERDFDPTDGEGEDVTQNPFGIKQGEVDRNDSFFDGF
jgi:hypothetical protein